MIDALIQSTDQLLIPLSNVAGLIALMMSLLLTVLASFGTFYARSIRSELHDIKVSIKELVNTSNDHSGALSELRGGKHGKRLDDLQSSVYGLTERLIRLEQKIGNA